MPIFRAEASGTISEMSDVYSFGIFLLELVTGQEALHIDSLGSNESFFRWVGIMLFIFINSLKELFPLFFKTGLHCFIF